MWQYIQTPDPDELYHSWTKRAHKYISRAWKKGKWVYKYPLTGKGYKENAMREQAKAQRQANLSYGVPTDERKRESYDKSVAKANQNYYDYYTKSLGGIISGATVNKDHKELALKNAIKQKLKFTENYTNKLGNHTNVAKVRKLKLSDIAKKLSKKG